MEEFNEILSDGERAIPALTRPDVFFVPLVFVVVRSSDVLIVEASGKSLLEICDCEGRAHAVGGY